MQIKPTNRSAVAFLATAALALLGTIKQAHVVGQELVALQPAHQRVELADQPERLKSVADLVPLNAVVGYAADLPDSDPAHFPGEAEARFSAIRYALAPRLVVRYADLPSDSQGWVLAEFSTPQQLADFEVQTCLLLVKKLGPGIALLRSPAS